MGQALGAEREREGPDSEITHTPSSPEYSWFTPQTLGFTLAFSWEAPGWHLATEALYPLPPPDAAQRRLWDSSPLARGLLMGTRRRDR